MMKINKPKAQKSGSKFLDYKNCLEASQTENKRNRL